MTAIVAPLGPNPAALTELCWALAPVHAVHAVLESERAARWFQTELTELAWPWLAACREVPEPVVHLARLPDGSTPLDSDHPDSVAALREPLWQAARAAQESGPAVFALSGGRWRASTALVTTVFQLLARPGDKLVEVRLSDPVAEGGTGFFFPDQPHQQLRGKDGTPFRAADIGVRLDRIDVPQLRPLLAPEELTDFAAALAASQARLAELRPAEVHYDLRSGEVHIDGRPLPLTGTQLLVYLCLLDAVHRGEPFVRVVDEDTLRDFLHRCIAADETGWTRRRFAQHVEALRTRSWNGEERLTLNALRQVWSKMRNRVAQVLHGRPGARDLVPVSGAGQHKGAWCVELTPGRLKRGNVA